MESITIHRALSQLKTTKSRIDKLGNATYVSSTTGQTGVAQCKPVADVEKLIISNYDSAIKLIHNYEELKLAIIRSNSGITNQTQNVARFKLMQDKWYTVAEIIALQTYVLPLWDKFIEELTYQLNTVNRRVETTNQSVNQRLTQVVSSISNKDDSKLSADQIQLITDTYRQNNSDKLVDPLDLTEKISELTDYADKLRVVTDAVLSEANALNKIQVNL